MPIITLTTDFGTKDYLVASLKGAILSRFQAAIIVDISHEINPFDIGEAAYILSNTYASFPKGSIHIIGVDALTTPLERPICALVDDHYFVCNNNGVLSLICSKIAPKDIVEIVYDEIAINGLFPTRDCFVPIACHLAQGGKMEEVGKHLDDYKVLYDLNPIIKENKNIIGTIIHIDNFGNVITNITRSFFEKHRDGRNYTVYARNNDFDSIYNNYTEIIKDFSKEEHYHGRAMALFNSADYLEIALYKGNPRVSGGANMLLGLKKGDVITIELKEEIK